MIHSIEITKLEVIGINRYTISSLDLNKNFYNGTPNAIDLAWAKIIDNAIDNLQSTRKYEDLVYRGQNLNATLVQSKYIDPYNIAQNNGTIAKITEAGYLSTSKAEKVADNFIFKDRFYDPNKMQVKFIISSKTGVDIDDISDFGKNFCADNDNCNLIQQEVLLKKGLEFDIVNIFDKVIGGKNVKIIKLNEK